MDLTPGAQLPVWPDPAAGPCQRWRHRTQAWQLPDADRFHPAYYTVTEVSERAARVFVLAHHYAGTWPATRLRYGLIDQRSNQLVGVAVLSVPVQARVLTAAFPDLQPYRETLDLGRFVLLDEVPANAESWFLARVFQAARGAGLRGLVSFSDPLPRTDSAGRTVFRGHLGVIYQATNAAYLGRTGGRLLRLLPDGTVLSPRALQKARAGEQGHEYVTRLLVVAGADPRRPGQPRVDWLVGALDQAGVRTVRHPGMHRYAFRLGRRVRIGRPTAPYPKRAQTGSSGGVVQ